MVNPQEIFPNKVLVGALLYVYSTSNLVVSTFQLDHRINSFQQFFRLSVGYGAKIYFKALVSCLNCISIQTHHWSLCVPVNSATEQVHSS